MGRGGTDKTVISGLGPRRARARRQARATERRRREDLEFARQLKGQGLVVKDLVAQIPEEWPRYERSEDPEPEWLERAAGDYDALLTFREVANRISFENKIRISKSQIQNLLRGRVSPRGPAGQPFHRYIVLNPDGADPRQWARIERDEKKKSLKQSAIARHRARYFAHRNRVVSAIYTAQAPWRDPELISELMEEANYFHSSGGAKIAGTSFETYFAKAFSDAGYKVKLYEVGNPGRDVAAGVEDDELLTGFSLKSQGRKNEKTGGKVEISSLTTHSLGLPTNVRETRKVLNIALEHLGNYEQILCLQSTETTFPDDQAEAANRYNLIEIPHSDVVAAIQGLTPYRINKALEKSGKGKPLVIPIQGERGRELFKVKIFGDKVAIAAIDPKFYTTHFSVWTKPPFEVTEPKEGYQRPEGEGKRRRPKKPSAARGP